jgi:Zn-dependent protease with chaperone function
LSTSLIESFRDEELEWVIMHEIGHIKYKHPKKLIFNSMWNLLFGFVLISFMPSLTIVVSIILGVFHLRVENSLELEANRFALESIENGVNAQISATKNFQNFNDRSEIHEFLYDLFTGQVPYSKRIKQANDFARDSF